MTEEIHKFPPSKDEWISKLTIALRNQPSLLINVLYAIPSLTYIPLAPRIPKSNQKEQEAIETADHFVSTPFYTTHDTPPPHALHGRLPSPASSKNPSSNVLELADWIESR